MRVFLDANVLISGIVFRGNEHELLKATLDPRHVFLVSEDILREVGTVLAEKFPGMAREGDRFLRLLPLQVVRRSAYERQDLDPSLRVDRGDAHVVLAALAGDADLLATGDKGLLGLRRFDGTEVVRPRAALRRLRTSGA